MFDSWFVLSVIPPLLYAVINHIDKHLLDKYFKEGGVGTLLMFSTLFSFFAIPYAIYQDAAVIQFWLYNPKDLLIMFTVGVLNVVLLYCYLEAMNQDDPSVVILYYQLVPVIAAGMSYVVLGETLSSIEWVAMAIILLGTTLATFELDEVKGWRFKWRTFWYMLVAATCWATETTLDKIVVIEQSVPYSIFWEATAMVLLGISLWVFVPTYRNQFVGAWKNNSQSILVLMVSSEAIYAVANSVIKYAIAIKVVAVVLLLQPLQSIFVYLLTVLAWALLFVLSLLSSSFKARRFDWQNMLIKAVAIAVTCLGTFLLLLS
jgi:drug/metabolite transporter (DMT)-like permease